MCIHITYIRIYIYIYIFICLRRKDQVRGGRKAPRGSTKARGAPPRGPGGAPHSRFTRVGGINLRKIKKTGKIRIGKGGLGQTPQVITTKPRGAPPRGPGGAPHSRFTRMGGHTPRKNKKKIFKIRIGKGDLGQTPQVMTTKPRGAPPRGPGGAPHSIITNCRGAPPRGPGGAPHSRFTRVGGRHGSPGYIYIYI